MLNGQGYLIGPNFAEKLHETVRRVEGMPYSQPTRIETRFEDGPTPPNNFRVGTYDGSQWATNGQKTVTLTNVGATGYTVLATNIFGTVSARDSSTANCAIAKDGTAWYMVQPMDSGSGLRAGTFDGSWPLNSDKTVTRINGGGTVNVTNIIYSIPDAGQPMNCVFGQDGTAWYLANVQHRSTNVLTRVAIEGSTFVFNKAGIQVVGDTTDPTTFPLDVCNTYTNTATTTTASSGGGASYSATSYFLG